MGAAGLLTFTACYGPYIPPEELPQPQSQENAAVTIEEDQQVKTEAEEPEADVTAEL